ncbi:rhamnan synthesis F family protein [Microbacterium sp. RG1]|uniref:rhamnan synthesis F family protein n=1 Tax=Microbacterium sp. RG1 TaxID=2489212 RepID=UPI0010CA2F8E|nr:rhamnan synthesis F family protein [Microbacterium sp. RG1]QCQ15387.1 hypothetical protein EHF32_00820 [Microbacterium sp. RG1]
MKQNKSGAVLPAPLSFPSDADRLVVYAIASGRNTVDRYVSRALAALRPHATALTVLVGAETGSDVLSALREVADHVVTFSGEFRAAYYELARVASGGFDQYGEVLLTGDGWYGPGRSGLGELFTQSAGAEVHIWELIEQEDDARRSFPEQGFPVVAEPYLWTVLRPGVYSSPLWSADSARPLSARARAAGLVVYSRFTAASFGTGDPAVFAADRLVQAGAPVFPRAPFVQYPPYLQQFAVIGRELLHVAESEGFVVDEILQNLARTLAPRAMSANLAMLEIIQRDAAPARFEGRLRVAVVMHVSDVAGASAVLARLQALPPGYRLIVTTTNGVTARRMTELVSAIEAPRHGTFEVRVTPSNQGRDMSDMFIACRDVLLDGSCDVVVKVHARPRKRKTMIMDRYFRRYQLENLLDSEAHVSAILRMFEREPGLGLVFPPMMHIGYQISGRGWAKYRPAAGALTRRLGIRVPLDTVSPNAPFGGMWFARPEALSLLARERWSYRDYNRSRTVDLGRLQERLVTAAAGEVGYHSRTVLTAEHAEISHTALEFKVDQMFSTTTGYPVDQITLLQRAGHTGRGGLVGLSRMYLRLNHPHLSRVILPVMALAERVWHLGSRISAIGQARERARTSRRGER